MKSYEKDYHLTKHSYLYNDEEYYLARAKVTVKQHLNFSPNYKILEYGMGLGQNIYLIPNAIGYDISKFALDFCREKGIKVIENLKELKNNSFDIIFCSEVLEHVRKPFEELKVMHSKLKKGGKLILTLPIYELKKVSFELDNNQELYCWDFRTINNLLIKIGFRPIENKILRGAGYKKLLFFSRINFDLYMLLTKIVAVITGSKHIKVVAIKR